MHSIKIFMLSILVASATASAAMGAPTDVTIVDPRNTNRAAGVEAGRLAVQEVPPANFFHAILNGGLSTGSGCITTAVPPTGKALIVRQVRLNVTLFSGGSAILIYPNGNCAAGSQIGAVSLNSTGLTVVPFDPGLAIPSGGSLAITIVGGSSSTVALAYVDGYTVPASEVP